MMLSRLLTHLDAAIDRADSPLHAACLRAERAGHLARQGQHALAASELATLQHNLAWQPSDKLRTWVLIAEGIAAHSQSLGCAAAHQHFEAAYAMTERPAAQSMRPLAAAWCACMAHGDGQHALAARMLRVAFVNALPSDHATRMRAALVAADAYNQGARPVMAARWYEVSRRHAVAYGDEAHISGMLFNQASWVELGLRMQGLFGDALSAEARAQVVASVDSTAHFDQGLGLSSVPALLPMMRAQALTSIGAYAKALALFEQHLDDALLQGMNHQDAGLHADRAWCEVQLQQPERARLSVALAEAALLRGDAWPEELAMAHERLSHVVQHLADPSSAAKHAHHAEQAQQHLARFRAGQAEAAVWLDKDLADIAPSMSAGHGLASLVA
jgi:tetratricopeptide (TPR) repeat protein